MRSLLVPVTWTDADGYRPRVLRVLLPAGDTGPHELLVMPVWLGVVWLSLLVGALVHRDVEALLTLPLGLLGVGVCADRCLRAWNVHHGSPDGGPTVAALWQEGRLAVVPPYLVVLLGGAWAGVHVAEGDAARPWWTALLVVGGFLVAARTRATSATGAERNAVPYVLVVTVLAFAVFYALPEGLQDAVLSAYAGSALGVQVALLRDVRG